MSEPAVDPRNVYWGYKADPRRPVNVPSPEMLAELQRTTNAALDWMRKDVDADDLPELKVRTVAAVLRATSPASLRTSRSNHKVKLRKLNAVLQVVL